jgi:hypothetical protein
MMVVERIIPLTVLRFVTPEVFVRSFAKYRRARDGFVSDASGGDGLLLALIHLFCER